VSHLDAPHRRRSDCADPEPETMERIVALLACLDNIVGIVGQRGDAEERLRRVRLEAEGARLLGVRTGAKDLDGRVEVNVLLDAPLDAPLPSYQGMLVNTTKKSEKVEMYGGIRI